MIVSQPMYIGACRLHRCRIDEAFHINMIVSFALPLCIAFDFSNVYWKTPNIVHKSAFQRQTDTTYEHTRSTIRIQIRLHKCMEIGVEKLHVFDFDPYGNLSI